MDRPTPTERLIRLINDILDLEKIEGASSSLLLRRSILEKLVEAAITVPGG